MPGPRWLLLALLAAPPALARTAPPAPLEEVVEMHLVDVDLSALVAHMSRVTGRAFVLGASPGLADRKVTILVPGPVSPDEAWELFLSALQVHGLALSCSGPVHKVIDAAEAARVPLCAP